MLLAAEGAAAADVPALSPSGRQLLLRARDIEDLRAALRGRLLLPGQNGYDEARRVWNGAFDRRPALIARCAGAADVARAVNFARANDVLIAVRGGGHSLSGQSVCEGGLMIDLSMMRGIRVDPAARTARVEPGALLGDLDREAQAFGLVTPAGTVSHTGVAGLTLGGGFGRLARKFGLTCDNLLAVDLVPADGRLLHASASENADLFWALRGGGGNFGVVTSFEYRLHPFTPTVLGGPIFFPLKQARDGLRLYSELEYDPPDDVYVDAALAKLPDGQRGLVFDTCYAGSVADGEKALARLRKFGKPIKDAIAPVPYMTLQTSSDEALAPGYRYYVKGGFLPRIENKLIDTLVERMRNAPDVDLSIVFAHIGGAAGRVKPAETAFWQRDARSNLVIFSKWQDPARGQANIEFARAVFTAAEPFTSGFYVNDLAVDDSEKRIRANYGGNLERLSVVKAKYDPANMFRLNANIPPGKA
jgi:hypothetical protein